MFAARAFAEARPRCVLKNNGGPPAVAEGTQRGGLRGLHRRRARFPHRLSTGGAATRLRRVWDRCRTSPGPPASRAVRGMLRNRRGCATANASVPWRLLLLAAAASAYASASAQDGARGAHPRSPPQLCAGFPTRSVTFTATATPAHGRARTSSECGRPQSCPLCTRTHPRGPRLRRVGRTSRGTRRPGRIVNMEVTASRSGRCR